MCGYVFAAQVNQMRKLSLQTVRQDKRIKIRMLLIEFNEPFMMGY